MVCRVVPNTHASIRNASDDSGLKLVGKNYMGTFVVFFSVLNCTAFELHCFRLRGMFRILYTFKKINSWPTIMNMYRISYFICPCLPYYYFVFIAQTNKQETAVVRKRYFHLCYLNFHSITVNGDILFQLLYCCCTGKLPQQP